MPTMITMTAGIATFEGIVVDVAVKVFGLIVVIFYPNLWHLYPMMRLVQQAMSMFVSSDCVFFMILLRCKTAALFDRI